MEVFVCYPSEHVAGAREVCRFLASVNVPFWWDKEKLIGGQDWDRARRQALKRADVVVILCSEQTESRDGVYQREIGEALQAAQDRRPDRISIICLRIAPVELRSELQALQYVDLFSAGWQRRLALSLQEVHRQVAVPPPAPLVVVASDADEEACRPERACVELEAGTCRTSYVRYDLVGTYWTWINAVCAARALDGLHAAWATMLVNGGRSDWELDITERYHDGDLVSLLVREEYYFHGAARPALAFTTLNFFGPSLARPETSSLFRDPERALSFLIDYSDLDLRRQRLALGDDLGLRQQMDQAGWRFFSAFTFNDAGMTFHFSEGAGLAHVFGCHEVHAPWDDVAMLLDERVADALLAAGLPLPLPR